MLEELNLNEEQLKAVTELLEQAKLEGAKGASDNNTDIGVADEDTVNKKIQSETDKIRTEYSKTVKALEAEIVALNGKLAEVEPVAKSDAEIALEKRQAEIDAKEQEINKKESTYKVREMLTESNLPVGLAQYLNVDTENADEVMADVAKIVGDFIGKQSLENNYKPTGNNIKGTSITKEQFRKMGYAERSKLMETNPELYKLLSK